MTGRSGKLRAICRRFYIEKRGWGIQLHALPTCAPFQHCQGYAPSDFRSSIFGEREEKRGASHKTFSYMGIWHQNHMRRQLFRPKCAMLEAEKNRGCFGSFGGVPIQPQTGVDPRSGHTRHSPVEQMGPGEVTVHQLTCHFTSLHSVSLRLVTQNGDRS